MLSSHVVSKRWIKNPTFIQYASWIALVLFIILYLLVTFWLILSPEIWSAAQPVAEIIITHSQLIRLFNAIMAFMCALFFFWPSEGRRLVGRWSDYVGLAFIMIFIQYGLRYLEISMVGIDASGSRVIRLIFDPIIYLCSGLNNLLFLAAARTLLKKNKRFQETQSLKEFPGIINANTLAEFHRIIPVWAWPLAFMSLFGLFDSTPGFQWARLPDAIFSAYCLGWFGYAMAINFNIQRRTVMATLALAVGLAYGIGQLVYATNPIIAYTAQASSNEIGSFPLSWIKNKVGSKVNEIVVSFNPTPGEIFVTPLGFLDSAVYAVLLLVRFAFFIPSFFLYLLFIISLNDFRQALAETISRRKDYLSSNGIVRAIGESLGANRVSLFIRIPGSQAESVLSLVWPAEDIHLSDVKREVSPMEEHPLLSKVMGVEGEEILVTSRNGEIKRANFRANSLGLESLLLVPIKFHGGVIGVLQADFKGYGKSNYTIIQKLRLMADLISPSVQDLRTLAAIDQIGLSFARLQVDHPEDNFEKATGKMADILHKVLSPLATGLIIEAGFFSLTHFRSSDNVYLSLIEEQDRSNRAIDAEIQTISQDKDVRLEKSQMLVRMSGSAEEIFSLGSLLVAVPAERDEFSHPTLAAYYRSRKAIASLITDGVLDLARDSLGAIIKDLGVKFGTEMLSHEEWFDAIVCAGRKAGLLWVVASDRNGKNIQGEREAVEIVNGLSEEDIANSSAQPLSIINADPQKSLNHRIIRIILPLSGHQLWLGVARSAFGQELDFQSPWRLFLLDLLTVADTALDSIYKREVAEGAKLQAGQYQGVMTIAITTGTLMHQLINMIKDQLFATESLEEALRDDGVELDKTCSSLMRAMKRSAGQMLELTEAFKGITKMDERRPCYIKDAAEQAISLYKVSFMQKRVEVRVNVPPDIYADVPFHVAAFALANLIGNAKDAVDYGGKIEIEAEEKENGKFILCHVTNDGPEIPGSILKKIFELGISGKDGHNGWGLYFVSRSLTENGGSIELAYTTPKETRFTIRLPKWMSG